MTLKRILVTLLACMALAASAQPTQQQPEWEWYLDEVVSETFVGRNYFEYYYTPSAADMAQQRDRGEVTYFLNSPDGLNSKKVRDMIDHLMMSYDDIKAVSDWHMTNTTYWKEFRYEKNKFRFSVKRKALDDGTYYVSVTETAGFYKSLGKKDKQRDETQPQDKAELRGEEPSERPSARRYATRDRKPVVVPDERDKDVQEARELLDDDQQGQETTAVSEKEQRRLEKERQEAEKREARAQQRREEEKRREQARALKEAEKLKKAEAKKQRQEAERLKKEEKKRQQEAERERQRQERAAREQAAQQAKKDDSRYHQGDVALWLSEKYDFTQTAMTDNGCTMFSTAVKDVEMAKLAIKNALKGSNARMAVPWRVNSASGAIETGYTVDGHVLVFTIGKDDQDRVTLTITEVSGEDFELFKKSL